MTVIDRARMVDLEDLMLMLPYRTADIADTVLIGRMDDNKRWSAVYRDVVCIEDTPKEAVIQLLYKIGAFNE